MLSTSLRTPVGLKIQGADITKIQEIGPQVEEVLSMMSGTRSVFAESVHILLSPALSGPPKRSPLRYSAPFGCLPALARPLPTGLMALTEGGVIREGWQWLMEEAIMPGALRLGEHGYQVRGS